jgi:predicted nucleic acid-binding protein
VILADSSVWIHHLRKGDGHFAAALDADTVLTHPFVIGELALGSHADRSRFLWRMERLARVPVARHESVMTLIESETLFSKGIGYVDAHLLASTRVTPGTRLWSRDNALQAQAQRLGVGFEP